MSSSSLTSEPTPPAAAAASPGAELLSGDASRARAALAGHALYLDVDGTLLDLAPTPEAVQVPPMLLSTLERLWRELDGALAFVSGRTIEALDVIFRPLKLPAIGVHGGQVRDAGGEIQVEERWSRALQAAEPLLRRSTAHLQGVLLENKGCAIALHYRAAPQSGREVLRVAELVAGGIGPEFQVLHGKCVVELRPRELNKGAGLLRLMQQPPFRSRIPIFAGDDATDEDAFVVVNRLGGISVRVGDAATPTVARQRLDDPGQLRAWLRALAGGESGQP